MKNSEVNQFLESHVKSSNGYWAHYSSHLMCEDGKTVFISGKEAFETYLKDDMIYLLDVPIVVRENLSYKLGIKANSTDFHITLPELLARLKTGNIKLKLNGYWNNKKQIAKLIIEKIERDIFDIKEHINEIVGNFDEELTDLYNNGLITWDYYRSSSDKDKLIDYKIYSLLRYEDILTETIFDGPYSRVETNDVIALYLPTADGDDRLIVRFGKTPNEIQLGMKRTNNYKRYCSPSVSTIEIKKSVTFFNFLRDGNFDEESLFPDRKPNLCSIFGREAIQKRLAEFNIGYGQTTNTSFYVWENEEEFILVDSNLNNDYSNYLYCMRDGDKDAKKYKKGYELACHLDANYKLLNENRISMEMWRWMCAETDSLNEQNIEQIKEDGYLTVPYTGKLEINNVYHSKTNHPDSVIAIIKKIR